MRPVFSDFLDEQAFACVAARAAVREDADLFFSGRGIAGAERCIIALESYTELLVDASIGKEAVAAFCFDSLEPSLGYLSYPYGQVLRGVPSAHQSAFPLGHLKKYRALIEHDLETGATDVYLHDHDALHLAREVMAAKDEDPPRQETGMVSTPVESSLGRGEYLRGVERTLEHIRRGDTYQFNLSTRFTRPAPELDMAGLFLRLWRERPAAFYALVRSGEYEILSTSPERFLKVEDGEVLSQPIKGTLAFEHYAPELVERLTSSAKESAELSMIVDLIRNDISANCEYGSVHVTDHKSTFVVDRLVQMYANVHGRLRQDRTCVDLLLDAFPGGSVTGCPKRRSMEIIEALEPHCRDIYCGSFVIIRDERNMDSSIAIRTAYRDKTSGEFSFFAGSGIVVDSEPEREYSETMAKAEKFLNME